MASDQMAPGVHAVIVGQGKVLDFIDGETQRRETPEEYVRQEIAKSLVREYRYAKRDIAVEFTLRVGVSKPRADLVIFQPGSDHTQSNAFLIVECKSTRVKATDRKDGVGQLQSYMAACPNVTYGMWTNSVERYCYRRVERAGRVEFEEVPDVPVFGQAEDTADRPRFDQLKPATSDALLFAFRRCHNYIAGNQGLQKPQAFWELLKLIFCKIHDERHNDVVEFYAGAQERHGVNGPLKAKKRIDDLFSHVRRDFPMIFREGESIELEPTVLAYIVSQLQLYSLLESDVDVKGRAYEEIVGANLRGDRGEFFTPRNVCAMAVAMLDPGEDDRVLDPACGTGGFLIIAMNHVIEKIRRAEETKWGHNVERAERAARDRIQEYARHNIFGIDFNPDLVKASKMNMVMNNDGSGGLFQGNSLLAPALWSAELREASLLGTVDRLFTNPPFGSKIQVSDPTILQQYDLGHVWHYDKDQDKWTKTEDLQKSQPPEILFIERCAQFLRPGTGQMAIVLPDGILGSPGLGYVREWLLQQMRLLGSVDLHPDTFQPFVSIQTSILVLRRKTPQQVMMEVYQGKLEDYLVFMAVANHVGHDKRGNITYVRDADGNEIVEDVDQLVKEWVDGVPTYRHQITKRKVVDDNLHQIAREFRQWLTTQD